VSTEQRTRPDPTGQRFDRFRNASSNATTELVLVRHGQTAANIAGLLVGRQDVLLTDLGHEQARRAAAAVAPLEPDALVSSPLQRARQTARPIAERTLLLPDVEDDIAEFGFGDFEGWNEKDALARHPHLRPLITGEAHPDERWPNGESGSAFVARIFDGMGRVVAEHPNQRVVVVTHGGVIGSWVARMATEGATSFFPYLVHNCSISTFEVTSGGTTCVSWNQTTHLDGLTGHEG
jgi:broad specificity phosphatase PhoE